MDLSFYHNKRILIIGATGTVGKALAQKLIDANPKELRLLDFNETEMFFFMEQCRNNDNVVCLLGDIRDKNRISKAMEGVDIVFHCAAYKHVILSEYNPFDVIRTNVIGVQNVIQAALNNRVDIVLYTSTDKAVNPTNVMGVTKLLGEKLMTAANIVNYRNHTVFVSTRFGNVIGSRGSVVPLFIKQIKQGGPVTVTNKEMTRFVMTIDEATDLVLSSAILAKGGEVFITKMPVMKIIDLAQVMIEILAPKYGYKPEDIKIEIIGTKPGEKLYEELMTEEERHRSLELKKLFVTIPSFKGIYHKITYEYPNVIKNEVAKPYNSSTEQPMSYDKLKQYLLENRVLDQIEEACVGGL